MAALQKVREGGETANKSKGEGERAMNEAAQEFGHLLGYIPEERPCVAVRRARPAGQNMNLQCN